MRNICILILLLINSKAWSQKISVDTNIIFVGQQAEIKYQIILKILNFGQILMIRL